MKRKHCTIFLVAPLVLSLSGCSTSTERPVAEMASAQSVIEQAEQSGAREYSGDALGMARRKLDDAERAADEGRNEEALRLATQAELDAEYAVAKASRGKAEDSLEEINDGIQTLREEIARTTAK